MVPATRFLSGKPAIAFFVFLVAIATLSIDLTTKSLLFHTLITPGTTGVAPIITLVHHENRGVIANAPIPQPLIIIATILIIGLVLRSLIKTIRTEHVWAAAALGLLLGGALGNLADRILHGYVFDWILLFSRSAVNLADAAIVIGAAWYLWEARQKK